MIDQLLEKYLNAFKGDLDTYEIFLNPNSKEIKDVEKQGYDKSGFRFLIDFKKKDVYIWSNRIIHRDIISKFKGKYWNIDFVKYLDKGIDADRYFTGHVEIGQVWSDLWRGFEWRIERSNQQLPIDNFKTIAKFDKSWLNKYNIDSNRVQQLIDNVLRAFEYRENNK